MENDEQNEVFKALVERCAGPVRKEQESYLARVIMKSLIKRYGRDGKLPDANVFRALGRSEEDLTRVVAREPFVVGKVLDEIYSWLAKSLLDNQLYDLHTLRREAVEYMQENLKRRQAIQREAGL